MLNLAFWNLNKKSPEKEVEAFIDFVATRALGETSNTIVGFAEATSIDWAKICGALGSDWRFKRSTAGKIYLVTNIDDNLFIRSSEKGNSYFLGVARTTNGAFHTIIVCFVHLESPFGKWSKDSNAQSEALKIRNRIVEVEDNWSLADTVVLGDFNMDPFEYAMTNGRGLNAAMCQQIAKQTTRTFGPKGDEETVRFFYNPMWRHLGDRTSSNQPGSYYNSGDKSDAAVWHCIDQVLVRPSLIGRIVIDTPSVVARFGAFDLLSKGGAPKKSISDHLPVLVSLNL